MLCESEKKWSRASALGVNGARRGGERRRGDDGEENHYKQFDRQAAIHVSLVFGQKLSRGKWFPVKVNEVATKCHRPISAASLAQKAKGKNKHFSRIAFHSLAAMEFCTLPRGDAAVSNFGVRTSSAHAFHSANARADSEPRPANSNRSVCTNTKEINLDHDRWPR